MSGRLLGWNPKVKSSASTVADDVFSSLPLVKTAAGFRVTSWRTVARTAGTDGISFFLKPMPALQTTEHPIVKPDIMTSRIGHLRTVVSGIPRGRQDRSRLILVFGVVLYVLRVIGPGWRTGFPSFFPDSASYLAVSRLGPFDPSFWWAERAVGVPFMIWLTGGNERLFFLMQTLLFAVAVAFLVSVVLRLFSRRWLAWITAGAITSISVHPRFGLWHLEILSESLALTLSLFMIAAWLRVYLDPSRRHLIIGVAATAAWMSVRDVHVVTGFIIAAALLVWGLAARTWDLRKVALVGAGVLTTCCSYVLLAQGISDRNLPPLINNVGERVLPNPEITRTFVELGMPLDDALRARTGADSWSDDQAFLLDPDLEAFRSWADDRGQRALLTSMVVDATFWAETTGNVLRATLPLDFTEYDRHSTSERLPTRLFWFQGPRTPVQLAVWAAGATAALVAFAMASTVSPLRRRMSTLRTVRPETTSLRRAPAMAGVALTAVLADLHVSASGDSVEVQRHVLGSVLRISVLLVIVSALGIQLLLNTFGRSHPVPAIEARQRTPMSISGALAASLGALGIFGAWIALEHRSQDFDPQYARTIIERAARYGGSYYENGIHNKGPLETAVYDAVRLFTSFDTYWFGISAQVLLVALVLGSAAWRIATFLGATRRIAGLSAVLLMSHFTLSSSDYAGVLYSRNITTAILAAVLAVAIWDRPWLHRGRATATYLALAALLGLAVQTLLPAVFAAVVLGAFLFLRRSGTAALSRPGLTAIATGMASLATAPLWYALRGSLREFWSNWWTYAGFMSSSTGRSLLDQIGLGGQKMFAYYQERPGILLLIVAFFVLMSRQWPRLSHDARLLHVALIAWLGAGWIELIVSQRYSSHYFSVIAVPTALIAVAAGVAVVDLLAAVRVQPSERSAMASSRTVTRSGMWGSIACVISLLAVQGTHLPWIAIEGAGRFRSTAHYVETRENLRSGEDLTRRAVIDLASSARDPLLAWTMYPWTYLDFERVPATRLSWKSFMIGEIYLGRTSSQYVLEDTWKWFAEDLAESQPQVYVRPLVTELVLGTPFVDYVTSNFSPVFADGDLDIQWTTRLWDAVTGNLDTDETLSGNLDPADGWSFDPESQTLAADSGASELTVPIAPCQRLSTKLVRISSADPMGLSVHFTPRDVTKNPVALHVDFDQSWSTRRGDEFGAGASVQLASTPLDTADRTELQVIVIVTRSAAALIVDDRIVSAVPLDSPVAISLTSTVDELILHETAIGDITDLAGC